MKNLVKRKIMLLATILALGVSCKDKEEMNNGTNSEGSGMYSDSTNNAAESRNDSIPTTERTDANTMGSDSATGTTGQPTSPN